MSEHTPESIAEDVRSYERQAATFNGTALLCRLASRAWVSVWGTALLYAGHP